MLSDVQAGTDSSERSANGSSRIEPATQVRRSMFDLQRADVDEGDLGHRRQEADEVDARADVDVAARAVLGDAVGRPRVLVEVVGVELVDLAPVAELREEVLVAATSPPGSARSSARSRSKRSSSVPTKGAGCGAGAAARRGGAGSAAAWKRARRPSRGVSSKRGAAPSSARRGAARSPRRRRQDRMRAAGTTNAIRSGPSSASDPSARASCARAATRLGSSSGA